MSQSTAEHLMRDAEHIAAFSPDPYVKVGAVIVDAQRALVLATGFNYINGVANEDPIWQDREARRACVTHAELQACLTLKNYPHYWTPLDMYSTHIPCTSCLTAIAVTDVSRIFWRNEMPNNNYGGTEECERVAAVLGLKLVRLH